jgi:hypothetical protein
LHNKKTKIGYGAVAGHERFALQFPLGLQSGLRHILFARAHGLWTYEPRQGRKAATAVCSAFAVVTLALFIFDL